MKIQNKAILLTMLSIGVLSTIAPSAFAAEVIVENAPGSSVQGCEETNECFLPYEVRIDVGDTVTWMNGDTAAHTATAGTQEGMKTDEVGMKYPGGNGFDSSLVMAGAQWSHTFEVAGTYEYFCMVHPWMAGFVIVGEAMADEGIMEEAMISIETGVGNAGEPLEITVTIGGSDGTTQDVHANFNIMATQGSDVVLDETVHSMSGMEMLTTSALPRDASDMDPVNVNVEFLGFGIGDDLTGTPETGDIQVVPEFGTIAMMILGVSIVSIIAISAKSRVILKL